MCCAECCRPGPTVNWKRATDGAKPFAGFGGKAFCILLGKWRNISTIPCKPDLFAACVTAGRHFDASRHPKPARHIRAAVISIPRRSGAPLRFDHRYRIRGRLLCRWSGAAGWKAGGGIRREQIERQMVKEMARLNQVSHLVTVCDWCTPSKLMNLVRDKHALVFCDIDGGEFSLFTPDVVEALRACDVFIELHGRPEENRSLIQRFEGRDPIVLNHPKEAADISSLTILGADAARMSVEYRPFQQWLVLRTKRSVFAATVGCKPAQSRIASQAHSGMARADPARLSERHPDPEKVSQT